MIAEDGLQRIQLRRIVLMNYRMSLRSGSLRIVQKNAVRALQEFSLGKKLREAPKSNGNGRMIRAKSPDLGPNLCFPAHVS